MFLRPRGSLRFSIYSFRRCIGFTNNRNFHLTHCAYLRNVSAGRKKDADKRNCESNPSVAGEFSINVPLKNVNDNFFGIESNEGVIEINTETSLKNNATKLLLKNVKQERIIATSFGTVRYDSENKPMYHGQLEKEKVLISSNTEKHKICDLNQTLWGKYPVGNISELSDMEKCSETTPDILDKNLKSKLSNSSYVDELYFPESYTHESNISELEHSPSSSNNNEFNFIEESYFRGEITAGSISNSNSADVTPRDICSTDKKYPFSNQETTEGITEHKLSSSQSSSIDNKSNLIEESYFSDKTANMSIFKSVNTISENSGTNKNRPFLVNEKPTKFFADGKQSNFSSRDVKFNTENSLKVHETETNIKTSSNLNENIEKTEVDEGEHPPSQWYNPSLEDLGDYNKFMSSAADLLNKKNNFLFQSQKFLKKSELIYSKSSSKERQLKSFPKSVDKTDTTEKATEEKEVVESSQETKNLKVKNQDVDVLNSNEQPETAYDFVKKLRSSRKKLNPELINGKFIQKTEQYDSKGFRILKNQVPDLSFYTRDEILEYLVKNVLYSDDDLIVLNKPYNLVMHESKTVKDPCLSQYLDDLAAELDKKTCKPKLITVHRLDKETCGCLLLARNEICAQRLLSFFSQRKIIKTYWVVTTKVPDPLEGVIDMPISEGSIKGRARMVLHPDLPKDISYQNYSKSGKRAVTQYRVISESGNAALVEVKPETGIKHQIRVHFGFGLSCPILGDHKYSHLDKLAPQKLQSDILQRLHVRQSKVRHIPLHIYARSILIPQYKEGRNLFVMAPMPLHMSKNLQKLKFRKK